MPRKSAAALSVVSLGSRPTRLCPPSSLSEPARIVFIDLINACKPTHFQKSDLPLLVRFAEAAALADEADVHMRSEGPVVAGRVSPWLTVSEKANRILLGLSLRLRISPQARQPNNPGKARGGPEPSYYDTMQLESDDGNGST
jgi:hypothetical protein